MAQNDIRDVDFTEAAWESLYDAVDATVFLEQDAEVIYDALKHRLKFISFGEYLKRYLYMKAGLEEPFAQVPLAVYQQIIKSTFSDNHTPASFTPTTAKLSALSKNWLTQQTVKRQVVFLLGFGLGMSVEDVNLFLTKALREQEINLKDPLEAICWFCYKHRYGYLKFEQLWEQYAALPAKAAPPQEEGTVSIQNAVSSVSEETVLMEHLARWKLAGEVSRSSATAKKQFLSLYDRARDLVAELYNQLLEERQGEELAEYRDRLSRNDRLYDFEKLERIRRFGEQRQRVCREDITEGDLEHIICAAIPTDRHGNLTPSKASKLNEQFAGKRFSRQRIHEILSGTAEVTRFDLITLNFFIFSQKLGQYPSPKQRYTRFLESTDQMLQKCFMGSLYIQNPYECFVLMCILSLDPLATYADVWELSYETEQTTP